MNTIAYSIIIPTSNRPNLLRRCLSFILSCESPNKDWEVLIVDNSNDEYKNENYEVVSNYGERRFRYFSMPPDGLMAARHYGIEMARGSVVCLIDDDSFISETWLRGVEETFGDLNIVLATGPILPEYESKPPDWLEYLWMREKWVRWNGYLGLLDFGNEMENIDPTFVWGGNYLIRKNIFLKVGGSHPDYLPEKWKIFQGDGEGGLSVKVKALGYQARYCPQCLEHHFVSTEKMSLDYLGARAFFIGLHSSFTQIRWEYGLGPKEGVEKIDLSMYRRLRSIASRIKSRILPARSPYKGEPEEIIHIKQYLYKQYQDGWTFHRNEVYKNPRLLQYVLRPNYIGENSGLPL